MTRLGRGRDGGYLVDLRDVRKSACLLSFGVNEDWSFERDFLNRRQVPLRAYDGSVDAARLIGRIFREFTPRRPHRPFVLTAKAIDYLRFFRGDRVHERKFVGPRDGGDFRSFSQIVEDTGHGRSDQGIFLKCDIEGGEYPLLNEFVQHAPALCGLVIEFHDLSAQIGAIEKFVDAFPLKLVHTHANNFAGLTDRGMPEVIECTFSSSAQPGVVGNYPLPQDRANRKGHADYRLSFGAEAD